MVLVEIQVISAAVVACLAVPTVLRALQATLELGPAGLRAHSRGSTLPWAVAVAVLAPSARKYQPACTQETSEVLAAAAAPGTALQELVVLEAVVGI